MISQDFICLLVKFPVLALLNAEFQTDQHRMVWNLKATHVPNPAVGRGTFHWFSKLLAPSSAQSLSLPAAFALQLAETLESMFN